MPGFTWKMSLLFCIFIFMVLMWLRCLASYLAFQSQMLQQICIYYQLFSAFRLVKEKKRKKRKQGQISKRGIVVYHSVLYFFTRCQNPVVCALFTSWSQSPRGPFSSATHHWSCEGKKLYEVRHEPESGQTQTHQCTYTSLLSADIYMVCLGPQGENTTTSYN